MTGSITTNEYTAFIADLKSDIARALPENLRGSLPTIDEIEAELRMATGVTA